jgi:C-terminal processing protease CtpA/Prc
MKKAIIISKTAKNGIVLLLVTGLFAAFATSCRKHDSSVTDRINNPDLNKDVNEWILENMQLYYLWETHIPSRTNQKLSPADYFESLLYRPADRFSWIQENYIELLNSLSGVSTEAGYDYNLQLMSQNSQDIIGYITYIKPGTPAEAAGLKRGDYFHKINGEQMTVSNYSSLTGQISRHHTLGISVISGNTITGVQNTELDVIENYPENPVLLDTVYSISDKKIGYFVYNFFARDRGDGSIAYEKELNDIFNKFKSEQIDELIVDLRYNSGGAVITAEALAKMISGQSVSQVFYMQEYNDIVDNYFTSVEGANYNKVYFIDALKRYSASGREMESIPINSLSGLSSVYFIVSGRSASASELLINGLKPYMNVVLVGGATYGKNVGSITIYEEDPDKQKDNKWGLQPIIVKMSNSSGFSDYGTGFVPDMEIYEYHTDTIRQLGDTKELMLHATLNRIFGMEKTGTAESSMPKRTRAGGQMSVIASSIDRTPVRTNQYISFEKLKTVELKAKSLHGTE